MARKKRTDTFQVPCGYLEVKEDGTRVVHKEVTIRELDHGVDRDIANREITGNTLLGRHIVQIGDITDPDRIQREVAPKILNGDYDYILIRLRILSLEEMYHYRILCTRKGCDKETSQTLDLSAIEVVDMPSEYAEEREMTYETDDGAIKIVVRHLTASDAEALATISDDSEDEFRKILALRLVSINGITPEQSLSERRFNGANRRATSEQLMNEALFLLDNHEVFHREMEDIRRMIKRRSGYCNMFTLAKCKYCRAQWEVRVPIGAGFFLPSVTDR